MHATNILQCMCVVLPATPIPPLPPSCGRGCRRNVRSTAEYIYSTLFEEGVNSDVTIVALGVCVCVCVCVCVRPMRNLCALS